MEKSAGHPELIVMLTYNDYTSLKAPEVFEQCTASKARYWGFKEKPLPRPEMVALCRRIRECGKVPVLEVVAYTEAEGLEGARVAAECGFGMLLGTKYFDSISHYCRERGIEYLPYVGEITGRPSVLTGTAARMVAEGRECVAGGADGVNLLGYRYTGDPVALNREVVSGLEAPVCIAGSIDSFRRLDEVKEAGARYFTIGSAFFDGKFGSDDFRTQVDAVCDYMVR